MTLSQLSTIARFVATAPERALAADVIETAKQCLVDWTAVSLAARHDAGPMATRRLIEQWHTHGQACNLYGDTGAAAPMALVNASLSHSLDYDDMHFATTFHPSGPTWATALAIGMDRGATEEQMLRAFVTGYEVGATMGCGDVGPRLADAGWHPTGILGHFSATSAAAVLLRLPASQIAVALGLAATQAAGLQASGGTMAKPYHVGKSAMNGVLAAELAALGMDANTRLFDEAEAGFLSVLFQRPAAASFDSLGRTWQIRGNTFKPYASCQLTHAAHEVARGLAGRLERCMLRQVRVWVHPLAIKVAGRPGASTPMEGKFSIAYCVSLGLLGHDADMTGFLPERIADPDVRKLAAMTRVIPDDDTERCAARIELDHGAAGVVRGEINAVRGSPGRPMTWNELEEKFLSLTRPILGDSAAQLLLVLRNFERPGQLAEFVRIVRMTRDNAIAGTTATETQR
ncbi:MmgE/PrpD family protein [Verticiella sediminum]|nr:MmgE/PrpD family protein [Verticiella sediminum]